MGSGICVATCQRKQYIYIMVENRIMWLVDAVSSSLWFLSASRFFRWGPTIDFIRARGLIESKTRFADWPIEQSRFQN
jgi:hypothetical protein